MYCIFGYYAGKIFTNVCHYVNKSSSHEYYKAYIYTVYTCMYAQYMYSAVHEVASKPIFVFNVIFMDIGTCYWCMLYAKMITKDY